MSKNELDFYTYPLVYDCSIFDDCLRNRLRSASSTSVSGLHQTSVLLAVVSMNQTNGNQCDNVDIQLLFNTYEQSDFELLWVNKVEFYSSERFHGQPNL